MSKQVISIIGPIGSFNMNDQEVNGIQLLDVVGQVSKLPADTTELQINVAGPGGRKDVGDNIYNFLNSLKPRMKIHTMQVGDIGSIMTKLFLVGDKRTALIGTNPDTLQPYEFFVHGPWTSVTGDATVIQARLDSIKEEEEELVSFYMSFMGLTREAIQPLMVAETGMDAIKALELKFATDTIEALNIAAYMENKTKTVGEKLDALILVMTEFVQGSKKPTMAMVVELEGAVPKISVASEDATKMQGAAAMLVDATGAVTQTPVPDGTYNAKDGSKITIAAGKVSAVEAKQATPPATPPATPATDQALNAKLDVLIDVVSKAVTGNKEKTEQERIDAIVAAKVDEALGKKKTVHRPTIKVVKDGKEVTEVRETPIQAMNRKQLETKNN